MKPFDLNTAPLDGVTLIEAGAGTGKTYTLTGLFLRLVVERGVAIDRILVVTYTKAATEELKRRIRKGLRAAKNGFARSVSDRAAPEDDMTDMLLARVTDHDRALERIQDAMTDFDRAAIFTIHGFCHRLLQYFAFETGHLFKSELVHNPQPLIQELADDFWRRHISSAPYEFAHFALKALRGPEDLAQVLDYCRYPDVRLLPRMSKPLLRGIKPFRRAAADLQRQWREGRDAIVAKLHDPGLNAVRYKKCDVDPKAPGPTPRQLFVGWLAEQMDAWNGRYPLFEKAELFSSATLTRATKKGHQTPLHPFFETCEGLIDLQDDVTRQMTDYLRYLKIQLHRRSQSILAAKKRQRNMLFFDDLLTQVHRSLHRSRGGDLIRIVRQQYKSALVDEFQDTDPLQYEIFQRLFAGAGHSLFMIGDPKQAIYSFRGADIYAYLKAAKQAQRRFTLTRNWRSTPSLVKAVNTLFRGRERPFAFAEIAFEPAAAARPDERWPGAALQLWYLTETRRDRPAKPMSQEKALPKIAHGVAEEIATLLSRETDPVEPRQVAVLTRTHSQSQLVKQALAAKQVPAVLHSAGSVFHSPEAGEMAQVLGALVRPQDHGRLRAALAGRLFSTDAAEFLQAQDHPSPQWQTRWSAFSSDHQSWVRHGFYPMFRNLMARERVKAKLLCRPDGERALTNLLHLAELLHQAETEYGLGPDGLVKWLEAQRQAPDSGSEDQQMRLESDSLAVRIITMHKSKGLQFDVVFCPFTWSGVKKDRQKAVFHDPDKDHALSLSIGPGIAPAHAEQADREAMAENLRMLYVALTRARHRCYLVWGRINQAELSAPAYLIHGGFAGASAQASGDPDDTDQWMARLKYKMGQLTDAAMVRELEAVAQDSDNTIAVDPLPIPTSRTYDSQRARATRLDHRKLSRRISGQWRIASFSSLTAGQAVEEVIPLDRDPDRIDDPLPQPDPGTETDLFHFPKGARAGLFFHDVLEHWDHRGTDAGQRRELISSRLQAHGFDPRWQTAVEGHLERLARVRLRAGKEIFSLSQVAHHQRINEMEFYFPLQQITPGALKAAFQPDLPPGQVGRIMQGRLERLAFEPTRGMLKGFIDAVICHRKRYYLVDWKSNHLGGQFDDYKFEKMDLAMAADAYFLQYHLYAVALDMLLRRRMAEYDYERHFGGVFYIFLRGVGRRPEDATGIFHARPDAGLIQRLERTLIAPLP